jgi:hypothetical protein
MAMREPVRIAVSGVREREQGGKERREVEAVVLDDHVDRETDKQESQMKRGLLRLAGTAMATRQSVEMVVFSVLWPSCRSHDWRGIFVVSLEPIRYSLVTLLRPYTFFRYSTWPSISPLRPYPSHIRTLLIYPLGFLLAFLPESICAIKNVYTNFAGLCNNLLCLHVKLLGLLYFSLRATR